MTLTPERLEGYDDPVVYCGSDACAWHVPHIEDGEVTPLCATDTTHSWKVTDRAVFDRRRESRMCRLCRDEVGAETDTADTVTTADGEIFVATTIDPPDTWHRNPDCPVALNADLTAVTEIPDNATGCTTCTDMPSASELRAQLEDGES